MDEGIPHAKDAKSAKEQAILDCGGKRSATPLWDDGMAGESGATAALCHRSPKNLCVLGDLCVRHK